MGDANVDDLDGAGNGRMTDLISRKDAIAGVYPRNSSSDFWFDPESSIIAHIRALPADAPSVARADIERASKKLAEREFQTKAPTSLMISHCRRNVLLVIAALGMEIVA